MRWPSGMVLLACASLAGAVEAAQPARPRGVDARRLIYTLEYVGTDYEAAVRQGKVVNEMEYGEVLRLTRQARSEYEAGGGRSEAIRKGLRELQELIERRVSDDEVWSATRRLVPLLASELGGASPPAAPPNLANGRRLWASDCAPCHGPTGAGDGPAAPGMNPPPTTFREKRLARLSPRQAFNAMTLGVDATAMPSFAQAYSEQQRWDVAFFLVTLRVEFEPKRPPKGVRFGLEELSESSNDELLARLRQADPRAEEGWVDYFRVNFASDEGIAPLAGPDALSSGMSVALQMQNVFGDVAERVFPRVVGIASYVRAAPASPGVSPAPSGGWTADSADTPAPPGYRLLRAGTGFLVDDDGYVLSSGSVVRDEDGEQAEFAYVELEGQTHLPARIFGVEPTLDLAMLRVADPALVPAGTAPLEFGDSDRLQVGHWLIALGDPPGPERTFAVGVVSLQAQRQCYQSQLSATLVQSSLIVPPAGVGGPVVDIFGRVVGMSVRPPAMAASVPGLPASTQTLPINLVLNLYEALKIAQSQRSPWIGVSVLELPTLRARLDEQARSAAIPPAGVYIDDVFDPSPAARAGVRPGDFLVAMNHHGIVSVGDFQTWLYVTGIDKPVELELVRDGKPLKLTMTIEARPPNAVTR